MSQPAPILDLDLFADASLKDPYPAYCRLRDAGAVVRLPHTGVYAIGRFGEVQAALRASDVLISGEGVGLSETFNASKGMNVIQTDGALHRRMRATVTRPLSPATLKAARADLKAMMKVRIAALTGRGWFDAMQKLAAFLPVEAVSHLVGLPEAGRDRMLEWAAAAFNIIGPRQAGEDVAKMQEAFVYMGSLDAETVANGSWAAALFAAAHSGKLSQQEAIAAISAYVIPSLDTTILASGHLLGNLATDPAQWALLCERPELIPAAVLEGVRHSSVLRWFSRVAADDYAVGDSIVPQGERVMLLYGCANRDERRYPEPDRFDVTRDARDHLAWGTGPHMCAGMHLARIEMEVLIEALVEAGVRLSAGEPVMGVNAGLYGFVELPFRLS
ncbi:cytochrome P450 [Novosphingobium sp.]|uniref:cytochrome P450 n=1 Tax=Novosphingobium sp. TaxID=1874826 RepID=UPI00286D6FD1|nr:cytochrome P450 [Novosphingobium sp.]